MPAPFRSTHQRWGRLLALALAWPVFGSLQPAGAATVFSYISSPYSYVGGGETVSVGPEDGFAFNATSFDYSTSGVSFSINDFASNPDFQSTRWWYLDLSTSDHQPLTVGSYTGATRYPFNAFTEPATPGLNFDGNGRGNNTLKGFFDVLEANVAEDGTVLSFAADFVQYDEGWQSWWNKGAIRFNSDLPIALTPEPINEEELIQLGYLPDPNASVPDETPIAEEPGIVPPIAEPLPTEEEGSPCSSVVFNDSCAVPIENVQDQEVPILWPDNPDDGTVWYFFSSGGSMTNMSGAIDLQPMVFIPAETSQAAPGPLPVAAALAGWQSARRLRRRCASRVRSQAPQEA